ncbi:MAG: class I SAM-dependent methyltransferase [Promethearchaeota archaeon]
MKNSEKEIWDELYKKESKIFPIQEFIYELIEMFKKRKIRTILDLACGSGRYLIHLLESGLNAYGLDISKEAIKIANNLLKEKALNAELTIGSMFERLPYNDNFFDAVICIRSLNHGTIEEIRRGIKEIERILKSGGLIFVTVRKKGLKRKRLPFKHIAPRTYIPLEGDEKGIKHYLFNKKRLRKEFKRFQICYLKSVYGPKNWESYYHLLGKLISP